MMKVCACLQKLKCLCVRLHGAVCRHCYRFGKSKRRAITISQPFDFKHISSNPMGLDEDEINVLREKAAASRMIAIEDQPRNYPSSAPCSPSASLYNNHMYHRQHLPSAFSFDTAHYHNYQPQRSQKTRSGYRSLASSANRGNGLSNSTLTNESQPSIIRSFVGTKEEMETQTSLSPTSSFTTASTQGSLKYEKRGFEFGVQSL